MGQIVKAELTCQNECSTTYPKPAFVLVRHSATASLPSFFIAFFAVLLCIFADVLIGSQKYYFLSEDIGKGWLSKSKRFPLLPTIAKAQPLPSSYDGYRFAKKSLSPSPEASVAYDKLYFTNLPAMAPCVLTGQLQLVGGDDLTPQHISEESHDGPYSVSKQKRSSIAIAGPYGPASYTPLQPSGEGKGSGPSDLLLLNSTLLKGCADRLIFSPIYTGVPDSNGNALVSEKSLFKAASTPEERSGSKTINANAVRARGTLLPIEVVGDMLLIGDVLAECVATIPSWQPSFPQQAGLLVSDSEYTLSALKNQLERSFEGLNLEEIAQNIANEKVRDKKPAANAVPSGPSVGAIAGSVPIAIAVVPDDNSAANEASHGPNGLVTVGRMDASNPLLVAQLNRRLSFPTTTTKNISSSAITTVAELILLIDSIPSLTAVEALITRCVHRQIRHNPLIYSLRREGAKGLPISSISAVLVGADSVSALRTFTNVVGSAIRKNCSYFFPSANTTSHSSSSATSRRRTFAEFTEYLNTVLTPYLVEYALPREKNIAASSLHDHVEFEHYYAGGPVVVAMGVAASSAAIGRETTKIESKEEAEEDSSNLTSVRLTYPFLDANEMIEELYQSDGYFTLNYSVDPIHIVMGSGSHNMTHGGSTKRGTVVGSTMMRPPPPPYKYPLPKRYATGSFIADFVPVNQQWESLKGRAYFNARQVFGRRPLDLAGLTALAATTTTTTTDSSTSEDSANVLDSLRSQTSFRLQRSPRSLRPAYEIQSKAAMRLTNQAPQITLNPKILFSSSDAEEDKLHCARPDTASSPPTSMRLLLFTRKDDTNVNQGLATPKQFEERESDGESRNPYPTLLPRSAGVFEVHADYDSDNIGANKQKRISTTYQLKAAFKQHVATPLAALRVALKEELLGLTSLGDAASSSSHEGEGPVATQVEKVGPLRSDENQNEHDDDVEQTSPSKIQIREVTSAAKHHRGRFAPAASAPSSSDVADSGPTTSAISSSWSNFYTAPTCYDKSPATCSPVGGVNVWGTTTVPPKGLYATKTEIREDANQRNSGGEVDNKEVPTTTTPTALLYDRFQPSGSIAVMVSSATTSALFHDITPAVSTAAADTAALLLVVDTISKSLLPSIINNGSLVRELLNLSPAAETNASLTTEEEDAMVLSALSQVYFFFFVGDDGAGFSGSGRFIKESLQFECLKTPKSDPSDPSGIDCEFPFYWYTNFTRTVELGNFTHFIALDGVLGGGGGREAIEKVLINAEKKMLLAAERKGQNLAPSSSSNSNRPFITIDNVVTEDFELYAYTDSKLDEISPAQKLVNSILSSARGEPRTLSRPSAYSDSDSPLSPSDLIRPTNTHFPPALSLVGQLRSKTSLSGGVPIDSFVVINATVNKTRTTISLVNTNGICGNTSNTSSSQPTEFTMLNFSYANLSYAHDDSRGHGGIHLTSTIPPSSLWSFMVGAYGEISDEDVYGGYAAGGGDYSVPFSSSPNTSSSVVPNGWRSRSFTLISSVRPDCAFPFASGSSSSSSSSPPTDEITKGAHFGSLFYGAGPATSTTLRTSRSLSGALDTYSALFMGSSSKSVILYENTTAMTFESENSIDDISERSGGDTVTTYFRLSASSRAQLRRRIVHSMLASVADVTANLLLGLIIEGSLRPLVNASTNPARAEKALSDVLVQITQASDENVLNSPPSHSEAHRLFYCLAANTNCRYMQEDRFSLGRAHLIPTEKQQSEGKGEDSPPLASIKAANYYNGVFGFYRNIPAQLAIVQGFLTDRLKSSYEERIGAHVSSSGKDLTFTSATMPTTSSMSSSSDTIDFEPYRRGIPCDPFVGIPPYNYPCPTRYLQCLADSPPISNNSNITNGKSSSAVTYSCYPNAAFYSHAFAPAVTYNPLKPSVASYTSDWSYMNGVPTLRRTTINVSRTNKSSLAEDPPFIARDQLAGLFFSLRIEVESYWFASGNVKDIGARLALVSSPAMDYMSLGLGLAVVSVFIAFLMSYCYLLEPRVLSRKEAEERDRAKINQGATETRNFYPLEDDPSMASCINRNSTAKGNTVAANENGPSSGADGEEEPTVAEVEVPKGVVRYA